MALYPELPTFWILLGIFNKYLPFTVVRSILLV